MSMHWLVEKNWEGEKGKNILNVRLHFASVFFWKITLFSVFSVFMILPFSVQGGEILENHLCVPITNT